MKRFPRKPAMLALAALLWACGVLDMGPDRGGGQRRLYVNDVADNDSLPSSILKSGVFFVMQPGKKYVFEVEGAVPTDYLQVLSASGGYYNPWKSFQQGPNSTFTLEDSTLTGARFYLAYLRSAQGSPGTRPAEVRLRPFDTTALADSMSVRLVMMRTLTGLDSDEDKRVFAREFMKNLHAVYNSLNIVLDTSTEIYEPAQPPFIVDFERPTSFPGTRRPNTVYMYLIDSIYYRDANPGERILGFAPREAFELGGDEVVLSAKVSGSIAARAASVATTAAHELGHFLGLRHTTTTDLDRSGDKDQSNIEDGFGQTDRCSGLTKSSARLPIRSVRMPEGKHYCLRVAAAECRTDCADHTNLMYPYQCQAPIVQDSLVPQQKTFVRRNLELFRR
jgi:hypothetical protein